MADGRPQKIALAITGASGALYAVRTLAELLARGVHVELVVSDYGRRLLRDELGDEATIEKLLPYLASKDGDTGNAGVLGVHSNGDRAVLDENARGNRPRPVAQPRRARGRRHAEGTAAPRHRAPRDADEPAG